MTSNDAWSDREFIESLFEFERPFERANGIYAGVTIAPGRISYAVIETRDPEDRTDDGPDVWVARHGTLVGADADGELRDEVWNDLLLFTGAAPYLKDEHANVTFVDAGYRTDEVVLRSMQTNDVVSGLWMPVVGRNSPPSSIELTGQVGVAAGGKMYRYCPNAAKSSLRGFIQTRGVAISANDVPADYIDGLLQEGQNEDGLWIMLPGASPGLQPILECLTLAYVAMRHHQLISPQYRRKKEVVKKLSDKPTATIEIYATGANEIANFLALSNYMDEAFGANKVESGADCDFEFRDEGDELIAKLTISE